MIRTLAKISLLFYFIGAAGQLHAQISSPLTENQLVDSGYVSFQQKHLFGGNEIKIPVPVGPWLVRVSDDTHSTGTVLDGHRLVLDMIVNKTLVAQLWLALYQSTNTTWRSGRSCEGTFLMQDRSSGLNNHCRAGKVVATYLTNRSNPIQKKLREFYTQNNISYSETIGVVSGFTEKHNSLALYWHLNINPVLGKTYPNIEYKAGDFEAFLKSSLSGDKQELSLLKLVNGITDGFNNAIFGQDDGRSTPSIDGSVTFDQLKQGLNELDRQFLATGPTTNPPLSTVTNKEQVGESSDVAKRGSEEVENSKSTALSELPPSVPIFDEIKQAEKATEIPERLLRLLEQQNAEVEKNANDIAKQGQQSLKVQAETKTQPSELEKAKREPVTAKLSEVEKLREEAEQAKLEKAELEAQLAAVQQAQVRPASPVGPALSVHAIVIGNGAYQGSGRLDNPINDARAISAKLKRMGFKVTTVENADRNKLVSSLVKFSSSAAESDLTLFFYAGHGVQISGTNYMLPTDTNLNQIGGVALHGISLNSVVEQFLPGKTKLVFLDACRDNPLLQLASRSVSRGLAPISVSQGTLISYATKDGSVAADGDGKNSPFTKALLQHIDTPEDIAVVLRKVRDQVMRDTGGQQQPWEYGSLSGGSLILSAIRAK